MRIFGRRPRSDLNVKGEVRGWHGGCPAAEPAMLGTYALVPGPKGRVDCAACGATDLTPHQQQRGRATTRPRLVPLPAQDERKTHAG